MFILITATRIPNFYNALSSDGVKEYAVRLTEAGPQCSCPGFTNWNHCKHADEAKASYVFVEATPTPMSVPASRGTEVTCSACGAWMPRWAFDRHTWTRSCRTYLNVLAHTLGLPTCEVPPPTQPSPSVAVREGAVAVAIDTAVARGKARVSPTRLVPTTRRQDPTEPWVLTLYLMPVGER